VQFNSAHVVTHLAESLGPQFNSLLFFVPPNLIFVLKIVWVKAIVADCGGTVTVFVCADWIKSRELEEEI
jgi:hypothetical protein